MSVQTFTWQDHNLHLSFTPSRLSITFEGYPEPDVYNLDLEGRPWNVYENGLFYQRGLDGKVVGKWIDPSSGRGRRWLTESESSELVARSSEVALNILQAVKAGQLIRNKDTETDLVATLRAGATYGTQHSKDEVDVFNKIYKPIGILPPDQYLAVALQASEGCSFNSCTFCEFYKGRKFHIKSPEDFEHHRLAVYDFLGKGLSLRRTVFLRDANALVIPTERLLVFMHIASKIFDIEALGGFYAFLDGFNGERKSVREYKKLRKAGLERIYISLESGHDPLLRFLNKPGNAGDAISAVKKMKSGGIPVGIIMLLGAGGKRFAEGHIQDTVKVLNPMNLDMDDQIYFSELIEFEGMPYAQDAFKEEIDPLDPTSMHNQAQQIEGQLVFNPRYGTPHISRYDIREFVY